MDLLVSDVICAYDTDDCDLYFYVYLESLQISNFVIRVDKYASNIVQKQTLEQKIYNISDRSQLNYINFEGNKIF